MSSTTRAVDIVGAAQYTGLSVRTLRHFRATNQGPPSYRLNRRVLYDLADLDAWVDARKSDTLRGGAEVGGQ